MLDFFKRQEPEPKSESIADAPIAHYQLGSPDKIYVYRDQTGNPLASVYRFDKSDNRDKKEFRPFCHYCHKWHAPDIRPIYNLDSIAASTDPIVFVEGEKCADALSAIDILATTTMNGSNGAAKSDLTPLKGRDIIIWPDYDEPGFKYADTVYGTLREIGAASIKIAPIDENTLRSVIDDPTYTLRKGWDAADAIQDGFDTLRIRTCLTAAVPYTENSFSYSYKESDDPKLRERAPGLYRENTYRESDALKPSENSLGFSYRDSIDPKLREDDPGPSRQTPPRKPNSPKLKENDPFKDEWGEPDMSVLNPRRKPPKFPIELFGPFWSRYILTMAESSSVPPDYVGASLLTVATSLIGNSRCVSPWEGWTEPAILWTALVGDPSSGKSPALDKILNPIRKIEKEGAESLKEELRQYEADKLAAECAKQDWEIVVKDMAKQTGQVPPMPIEAEEPLRPERPRIIASDSTPEALARLLVHQPKGILAMRDELSGWLGSFNRYSGGQGGDRSFWLEAYGARTYVIDRARNGGETVTIPNLSASVIGGIQPEKLHSLLLKGDDDGLTARFLYVWPDPIPPKRPQRVPESHEAETALRWLNSLQMIPTGENESAPGIVRLEEDAAKFFQDWREQHYASQPEGTVASWWGKMPGTCLRLALAFEYLWFASTTKQETFVVSFSAVEAATVMIDQYFKPMAERAYGDAALPKVERDAATLAKWISRNKLDHINTRVLQREVRLAGLEKAEKILSAIDLLIDSNWLKANPQRNGEMAGRKTNDFKINPVVFSKL